MVCFVPFSCDFLLGKQMSPCLECFRWDWPGLFRDVIPHPLVVIWFFFVSLISVTLFQLVSYILFLYFINIIRLLFCFSFLLFFSCGLALLLRYLACNLFSVLVCSFILVLALLIICCSDNGIKPIAYYWSTSCGNFLDINSYHSNNITS